jgi:hypothetical protein
MEGYYCGFSQTKIITHFHACSVLNEKSATKMKNVRHTTESKIHYLA